MQHLAPFGPYLTLALVLVAVVVIVSRHGRRLTRHDDWMAVLELRIANLHKAREQNFARSLQLGRTSKLHLRPPPPGTVEVTDDMIISGDTDRVGSPPASPTPKKEPP